MKKDGQDNQNMYFQSSGITYQVALQEKHLHRILFWPEQPRFPKGYASSQRQTGSASQQPSAGYDFFGGVQMPFWSQINVFTGYIIYIYVKYVRKSRVFF